MKNVSQTPLILLTYCHRKKKDNISTIIRVKDGEFITDLPDSLDMLPVQKASNTGLNFDGSVLFPHDRYLALGYPLTKVRPNISALGVVRCWLPLEGDHRTYNIYYYRRLPVNT